MILKSKTVVRFVTLVMMVAFVPGMTGCFGRFPLTRAVYNLNENIGTEVADSGQAAGVIQSAIMWLFAWIPVYGFAVLGDVFVLNLIEFWTGSPIELGSATTSHGDMQVTFQPTTDRERAELVYERAGEVISRESVIRVDDSRMNVLNESGDLVAIMHRNDAGEISLTDAEGSPLGTLPSLL